MDFIQQHLRMSAEERRELLCRVIRRKCKYPVPKARLDYIVSRLNLRRTYIIKTTNDPIKFLNIATSEHIEKDERILLSQVFPLYGRFTPGFFVKTDTEVITPVSGTMDKNKDAAAVKIVLHYLSSGAVSTTYTLVLYETRQLAS